MVGLSNLDGNDASENDTSTHPRFRRGPLVRVPAGGHRKPDPGLDRRRRSLSMSTSKDAKWDSGSTRRISARRSGSPSYATVGGMRKIEYRVSR